VAALLLVAVLGGSSWVNYRARVRADANLAAWEREQEKRLAQGKDSVPAFLEAARFAVEQKKFDIALAQARVAVEYDPDHAEARLLQAQVLIVKKDFAAARPPLEKYKQLRPEDKEAAELLKLCHTGRPDDPASDTAFVDVFLRQDQPLLAASMVQSREKLLALYRQRLDKAWPGASAGLTMDKNGNCSLSLEYRKDVTDLSPLKGIPLTNLDLTACEVVDLTPLARMPLTRLTLQGCRKIKDLSPLHGLRLTVLNLASSGVEDLNALRDMPLQSLSLEGTRVSNLSPLRGRLLTSLTHLNCNYSRHVADLSPLKGMKLMELFCLQTGVSDLSPLKDMKLTKLDCSKTQVRDLSPLVGMPLTNLHCHYTQVSSLAPLKNMKALIELGCGATKVMDLSPLRDMKLTTLNCSYTPVSDLSPLKDMNLSHLDCSATQVTDLTLLKGMKLTILNCANTRVTDLTPLKGMPLKELHCDFKPERDARILRGIKTLERINAKPAKELLK
jgi:Leucine-rich repeat (LRR) protein